MEFNDCWGARRWRTKGRLATVSWVRPVVAGALLIAAGCSFSIEQSGAGGPCRRQQDCTSGLTCVERICRKPPPLTDTDSQGTVDNGGGDPDPGEPMEPMDGGDMSIDDAGGDAG